MSIHSSAQIGSPFRLTNDCFSCANDQVLEKKGLTSEVLPKIISYPLNPALAEFAEEIENSNSIYTEIIRDLFLCSKIHKNIDFKRVIETTLSCAKIDRISDQIAKIKKETERVKLISRECGINAEPDFCPGIHFDSVKNILYDRTGCLRSAYIFSSKNDVLHQFFQIAFRSDPCLNGRIIALMNFQIEHDMGIGPEQLKDSFSYDEFAFKCTELMYGLSDDYPPNQKDFTHYLINQKDYNNIYKKWVESNQWNAIYARAVEFFN